jgi:hypothetical protein
MVGFVSGALKASKMPMLNGQEKQILIIRIDTKGRIENYTKNIL